MTDGELLTLIVALLAAWGFALVTYLPTQRLRREAQEKGITEALRDAYKLPVIRHKAQR